MPTKAKFQIGDNVLCTACMLPTTVTALSGRGKNRRITLTCDCNPHGLPLRLIRPLPSKTNVHAK